MGETGAAQADNGTPKPPRITGKLREACLLMVWGAPDAPEPVPPLAYDAAARTVGMSVRSMRKHLEKQHVQAFLRTQREVLRASLDARNLSRLAELRDQNSNMNAAVKAAQVLEEIGAADATRRPLSSGMQSPGFVILLPAPYFGERGRTIEHSPVPCSPDHAASPGGERALPPERAFAPFTGARD